MQQCTVRAQLKLPLTAEQVDQAAKNATHAMQKLNKMENDFALVKREENAKIKKAKLEVMELCSQFETKKKTEEVKCEQFFDTENNSTWYEYDGEKYEQRDMTEDEKEKVAQGTIFNDGPAVDNAAGEAFEDDEDETDDAVDSFLEVVQ